GLDASLCASPDLVATGYAKGVPMGSDLPRPENPSLAPSFVIQAMQDTGVDGAPLQYMEIVKGWSDGTATYEKTFLVGGDPDNGASVDPATCARSGVGSASLCSVWTDPEFDPAY